MLAELLFLDGDNGLSLSGKSFFHGFFSGKSLDVSLTPGLPDWGFLGSLGGRATLDAFSMLLSVLLRHFLVLGLIHLFWSLLVCLGHLLTHNLSKSVVAAGWIKPFLLGLFLFLGRFLLGLSLDLLDVWFGEGTLGIGLPVSLIELRFLEALRTLELTGRIVDSDLIVHLNSLMQDS